MSARLPNGTGPSYSVRRLAVDCYCLQHPDRYCVSAKSLAAHLSGLCWAIEFDGGESGLRALQSWLNGHVPLTKPPIPSRFGQLTVAGITEDPGLVAASVERWADSIWYAYAELHSTARLWIKQATGRP